jgi:hypothetical protein
MRMLTELLPYISPKLMAVAHAHGNMAEQLDRAIERMKVIEHVPVPKPKATKTHAADEMKSNFPKLRRRF